MKSILGKSGLKLGWSNVFLVQLLMQVMSVDTFFPDRLQIMIQNLCLPISPFPVVRERDRT